MMTRFSGVLRLLLLVTLVLAIAGCGRLFKREEPLETLPVEAMYEEGKRSLERGNYGRAMQYYNRLVARFPYGPYTEQAQLELAYAQFKAGRPDDATSTLNRFVRTYPTHQHIDYAYYLKGLINFNRESQFAQRFFNIDPTRREQGSPRQSFNDFGELLRRYPDSRYAPDARQRMVHLRNQLARHEMGVGLYYLRRGAYVAASGRGQYVLENFPQSAYQSDAVALMGEAYRRLGEEKLEGDMRRVLELNDPSHPWLANRWPSDRNVITRLNPFGGDL